MPDAQPASKRPVIMQTTPVEMKLVAQAAQGMVLAAQGMVPLPLARGMLMPPRMLRRVCKSQN
eukprot:CAMPEP_0174750866 /NCGR_PEP_ID=MMETSP1094-20130205/98629_1 /TAXON_ID=156173 /ORGANISM="Chrysochromulina brevifilum, Strain UTEX LB 985" /LENGTH=62 /DNA_ID=CAMNT_0015956273 /DNA_START=204 /DNA_END=393 /DNA_ORIENTATION=+